jgi:hypothetical protein
MSNELDAIVNGESATPTEAPASSALPTPGRERQAVSGSGTSVDIQIGDSFEGVYNGFSMVKGKFGESKSHRFTLIAPATLTTVSTNKETKVKSVERKSLAAGTSISCFLKGNGDYMMNSIANGLDVEVKRVEDGVLPPNHDFAGSKVATFEVLA